MASLTASAVPSASSSLRRSRRHSQAVGGDDAAPDLVPVVLNVPDHALEVGDVVPTA